MRTVFLGTPEFAVPSLNALVSAGHDIIAVFTQPDRPKGRGGQLAASPVKIAASSLRVPIYQPERIRRPENVELLRNFEPEMMVVVGYGQIIPQAIIDIPARGILNVHASLLPKYRGAAPIQWAIANGETETGVTIMQIDAGLDTGDMLLKETLAIGADETAPELSARLAPAGASLLIRAIEQIRNGTGARQKQEAEATFAPILKKEDGVIDWRRPAQQIYNRLRAFTPWPGAYTSFQGQQLSVLRAGMAPRMNLAPGSLHIEQRRLFAGAGDNTALELLEVQLAGKKRMTAEAFVNGYRPPDGTRLGETE
ncbi:MAG: methionyl-tRNA formyltransferase [Acidobacteriaceae bacterium]|nr:methionyl-tRNA formyltransferase [Acidobacteriaceae bacterium]